MLDIKTIVAQSTEDAPVQKKARIFVDDDDEPISSSSLLEKSIAQTFSHTAIQSRFTDLYTTMVCLTVSILLPSCVRPLIMIVYMYKTVDANWKSR